MEVLLVDPSLFTAPYDAALSQGLKANDVTPSWATRALRNGEEAVLDQAEQEPVFYRWSDGPNHRRGAHMRILKGLEHAQGLRRVIQLASAADLVHFQWSLIPKLDIHAIRAIRRDRPVILTVHDAVPYNGKPVSSAQVAGLHTVISEADRLIVHTDRAAETLTAGGVNRQHIAVIPHGLLPIKTVKRSTATDDRWHIVQFGKIQHYKGADVLIEALGTLDPSVRSRLQVTIAGEAHIDVAALIDRSAALGLNETLTIIPQRLREADMAQLLGSADTFIFPYRAIEASGVLALIAGQQKWIVASHLGLFADLIGRDETAGALVPPDDPSALAVAIVASIGRVPTRSVADGFQSWGDIGRLTLETYQAAIADWRKMRMRMAA